MGEIVIKYDFREEIRKDIMLGIGDDERESE